jgi:hypothetical protein
VVAGKGQFDLTAGRAVTDILGIGIAFTGNRMYNITGSCYDDSEKISAPLDSALRDHTGHAGLLYPSQTP